MNRGVNPVMENTFTPDAPDSADPMTVWHVAGVVWLTGVAVLLILAAVSYVRLRRRVRFAARLSGNVWQCDEIHVPFVLGILRPRIYLPSGIEEASMNYVLAHERAHLKRLDHWWKPFGYALLAVYWFHPLVWAAIVACVAVAVCFLTDPKVSADTADAEEAAFRDQLEREANEEIQAFFYEDLNRDGENEAVAITSEAVDELGYFNAKVWYITDETCDLIDNTGDASVYQDTVHLYTLSNTKMLCFTSGWGGSGSTVQAWVFDAGGAVEVGNVLEGISQLSEDEFLVTSSAYDGSTDGTGHTWNRYFSRWDGAKLVEYGGMEISEGQLREAENADRILDDVKVYGEIQSIYYKANGMVYINLCDGSRNRNVALMLADGELSYFDYGESGEGKETALEKATADGVILDSVTTCVMYPDKFPLGGAANAREKHAMISYMLDEFFELPATLYEGDGFSIYVPDGEDVQIYDKTLKAPGRLSVVWGHSIFIEVMCYEGKTISYVEEELERNGYAYDAVYDSDGKKMQKEEDYRLLSEARLRSSGGDVWVICTTYASAYDLGSQLDAIADTFQVTEI